MVVFKIYAFETERLLPCEDGSICRVLYGILDGEVAMPKFDAPAIPLYAPFFDVRGNFKRPSAFFA